MKLYFYGGSGFLDRLEKLVDGDSPYTHVAVGAGGVVYEANAHGVQIVPPERVKNAIAVKTITVSPQDEVQAANWLKAQLGHHYGFLNLLAVGVAVVTGYRVVLALDGCFICSALAAQALEIAGETFTDDPRLQTPASLAIKYEPGLKTQTYRKWRISLGGK